MPWNEKILKLLEYREEVDVSHLSQEFSCPECIEELVECLAGFEEEYGIRMGLLRRGDPLEPFVDPPSTRNPFTWLFNRAAFDDKSSELDYRLREHRKRIGLRPYAGRRLHTIGEYVRAWMGDDP